MARFDIYRGRRRPGYLLDCQSDHLGHLETRFVVPLLPEHNVPLINRLNPVFELEGGKFALATQLAFSAPRRDLGDPAGSLASEHIKIVNALDTLITGV